MTVIWKINGVNQTNTVTAITSYSNPKGTAYFSFSLPVNEENKIYIIYVSLTNYDYDSSSNNVIFPQTTIV